MKCLMKKSMKPSFVMIIGLLSMVFLFTNNSSAQDSKKQPFAEKAMNNLNKGFYFSIKSVTCFAGGTSLYIAIEKSNNYAFLWEIDGSHGGHQMNQECICGQYAKLRVMRLSDGLQMSQTVGLPSCGGGENN
jgi:hypothetical protein